ncbi:hypothetical protein [Minwuia thermotolerans]|uniref:Uncharacterized protein n=1 Tax=Minwuia thermotolerans TaxID=2056226 RepID=A0A2M9G2L1_9PROT|nr:hypothetical protein [Minwuia thermotolerans]PJK29959.1 hypothetical protein CVT23_09335 [Minwuia thermotolerans]
MSSFVARRTALELAMQYSRNASIEDQLEKAEKIHAFLVKRAPPPREDGAGEPAASQEAGD